MNKNGNFRTFTDLSLYASEGSKIPEEIQLLPAGEFNTYAYGHITLTPSMFDLMVFNFNNNVRAGNKIPVDTDHDGGAANGWIYELVNKGDGGLWGKVKWNKRGKAMLEDEVYKFISPEWSFDFMDPLNSTHHGPVMLAATITNRPLFRNMQALTASEDLTGQKTVYILKGDTNSKESMKIEYVLKKPAAERTEEEVKFLTENEASFTEEQKKQVDDEKAAAAAPEGKPADEGTPPPDAEPAPAGEGEPAPAPAAEPNKGSEGDTVTIKASDYADMQAKLKAFEEREKRIAVEKEVAAFMASDKGGKLIPAVKDEVISLVMTMSEDQKKAFYKVVYAMPDLKIAGEQGSAGKALDESDANALILSTMKANEGMTYKQAHDKVRAERPELFKN